LSPFVIVGEETGIIDTLSRLEKIVRRAPGRIVAYLGMTVFLLVVAVWPLIALAYGALSLTGGLTIIGLGEEKVTRILLAGALKWLGFFPLGDLLSLGLRYDFGVEVGASFTLASWIYSFSLVVILAVIYAFFVVFPLSCGCAIYISVGEEAAVEVVPKEVVKRYCIKCGAEVPPDAQFCTRCGAPQTRS